MDHSSFSDVPSFLSWYENTNTQLSQTHKNALNPLYKNLLLFRKNTGHLADKIKQLKLSWSTIEKYKTPEADAFFSNVGTSLLNLQAPIKAALKQATIIKESLPGVKSSISTLSIPEARNKLLAVINATPNLNTAWMQVRYQHPELMVEDLIDHIFIPPSEAKTKLSSLAQAVKEFKKSLGLIGPLDKLSHSLTDFQNFSIGLKAKFNKAEKEWVRLHNAGTESLAAFFRRNLDKDMDALFAWITPLSL